MTKIDPKQESAPQNVDLTSVLALIEQQNQTIAELKAQVNPENKFKKAKEKYEWPWNYSYKLWWGVPVLSYKSVRKDATKDFTYKNAQGVLINNHFLELTLADEKTLQVEIHEFNLNCTSSEKVPWEPISDGVTVTGYKFKDSEYGEFIVHKSLIN